MPRTSCRMRRASIRPLFCPLGQIDLRHVAGDDRLGTDADAGEEHLHLFRRGVLRFVENDEGVVQRAAAHVGQRGDLDGLRSSIFHTVETHQVVQRVVQRAQIGIDLLRQIAGQEAEALAGLDRRAGEHDALHQFAFEGVDRAGYGEIGLAGAGRTNAEGDVVFLDVLKVFDLSRRAAVQVGSCESSAPAKCCHVPRATRRAIEQFDQAELDLIDRQVLSWPNRKNAGALPSNGRLIRVTGSVKRSPRRAIGDIERGLDLAQVFVEHTAQVGKADVVDRREQQLDGRLGGNGGSDFTGHNLAAQRVR
jgi:hypothetical protein